MNEELELVECDCCGREVSILVAYSGGGHDVCFECYHDIYDEDEEE